MELTAEQTIRLEAAGMVTRSMVPYMTVVDAENVISATKALAAYVEKGESDDSAT